MQKATETRIKARLPMPSHGTNQLVTCLRGFARCALRAHIKLKVQRHTSSVDRRRYSATSSRFLRIATPSVLRRFFAICTFRPIGHHGGTAPCSADTLHALLHAWSVRIPTSNGLLTLAPTRLTGLTLPYNLCHIIQCSQPVRGHPTWMSAGSPAWLGTALSQGCAGGIPLLHDFFPFVVLRHFFAVSEQQGGRYDLNPAASTHVPHSSSRTSGTHLRELFDGEFTTPLF